MKTFIALLCAAAGLLAQLPAPGSGGGGGAAGAGTVTSVDGACGISGGPISGSGTLSARAVQNPQSGTSYSLVAGDCGKTVILTNAALVTVTVPVASVTYPDGWYVYIRAEGAAGASLARSAADTINGATSVAVAQGASGMLVSNGAGAWRFLAGGSGGGEPAITPGTTSQYWRGDKTWQTLDKTAVGLANVANVDTTNAGNIASGTLSGARLPNPAVGTKGGVESLTCGGTDKVSAIGTNGIPVCSADGGAGGGAPTTSQYVTLALDGGLSGERVLAAGAGVTVTDAGANGNVTIAADTAVIEARSDAQAGTSTYCRSTTGNDTYTCNLNPALAGYTRGMVVRLDADTANTGTATLNVQSLGAVSILKRDGTALSDGDITANRGVLLYYNGTNFSVVGDGGGAAVANQIYDALTAFDDSAWSNGGASLTRNTSVSGRVRYTITTAAGILATRQKSVAAGDFTYRVAIIPYFTKGFSGGAQIGAVLGDSGGTQKMRFCGVSINGSNAHSFLSQTWDSFFSTPANETLTSPFDLQFSAHNFASHIFWVGWRRAGSNLICEVSQDGKIWETVDTKDQTYITVTNIGVGGAASTDGSSARFTVVGGIIP